MILKMIPIPNTNVTSDAVRLIINNAFTRQQNTSIDDHMANEMEIVLEAYGKVAAKRINDEVPMIFQKLIISITRLITTISDGILDKDLEKLMIEDGSFLKKYNQANTENQKMTLAYDAFKKLQTNSL